MMIPPLSTIWIVLIYIKLYVMIFCKNAAIQHPDSWIEVIKTLAQISQMIGVKLCTMEFEIQNFF